MQKLAYKIGQFHALKQLSLIKLGTPRTTQLEALRQLIAAKPITSTSAALGTGYGLSSLVQGKPHPMPPHTYARR